VLKLKYLLVVNAAVLGASGISAVLMPAKVLSMYDVILNPEVIMMAQYAGLGSIAIALVAWFNRNAKELKTQRAIGSAFLITYVIAIIISVQATISGTLKVGWPIILLYLLLALCYANFLFVKRRDE
jgi:hypothetical protein